jgi:hypothetical protein
MIKTLKKSELFQALCLTLSLLYYDYDANSILAKFLIGIFAYHLIFPSKRIESTYGLSMLIAWTVFCLFGPGAT